MACYIVLGFFFFYFLFGKVEGKARREFKVSWWGGEYFWNLWGEDINVFLIFFCAKVAEIRGSLGGGGFNLGNFRNLQ